MRPSHGQEVQEVLLLGPVMDAPDIGIEDHPVSEKCPQKKANVIIVKNKDIG